MDHNDIARYNRANRKSERRAKRAAKAAILANTLIIEICPKEPRASACLGNGNEVSSNDDISEALADCTRSGDCEPACQYVLANINVEFRIVAHNAAGEYENRLATAKEKEATARAIYFESESDFTDETIAESYLVWDAANSIENE